MNDDERAAACLLLDRLGIDPTDLLSPTTLRSAAPTVAQYMPALIAAVSAGARTTYLPYWHRAAQHWPDQPLHRITATDVGAFAEHIRTHATPRRNTRDGRCAAENAIAALRCLFQHAIADGHRRDNPATHIPKPRRLPSTRTALTARQLQAIHHIAATTGNDPALDTLLLRLHTETACRRGGALALRPCDLDPEHCLIRLREKAGTVRWQPVSPTLMHHLQQHACDRHAPPDGQLLCYANGRPITRRRYDYLWTRIGAHLPWVASHQVTIHWLRHTTLTWVERHYGHAVARAYAGHTTPLNATDTYTHAGLPEIATALAHLTGEPHPLAQTLS